MSLVANVIYNLLAIVGVVLGMAGLVYIMTILFDKFTRLCRGDDVYVLTPEELVERQQASNLTKRAGLAGILPEERVRIFQRFFTERALPYKPGEERGEESSQQQDDLQTDTATAPNTSNMDDIESQQKQPKEEENNAALDPNNKSTDDDQELEDLCMTEHNDSTCPICLSEYVEGDKIITGSSCSHKFHLECGMQWLEKGNDHCAYCRKDMMTPEQLLETAKEELGTARVKKIAHINQTAAQRLAEYEAALAAGADTSEVSRQLASGTLPGDQQRMLGEINVSDGGDNHSRRESSSQPMEVMDV